MDLVKEWKKNLWIDPSMPEDLRSKIEAMAPGFYKKADEDGLDLLSCSTIPYEMEDALAALGVQSYVQEGNFVLNQDQYKSYNEVLALVESKDVNLDELSFEVEETAYYSRQRNSVITALLGKKRIGRLEYTEFENKIYINFITVEPQYRRKGVATRLYEKLKKEEPGLKIIHGMTVSPEGEAWRNKVTSGEPKEKPREKQDPFNEQDWDMYFDVLHAAKKRNDPAELKALEDLADKMNEWDNDLHHDGHSDMERPDLKAVLNKIKVEGFDEDTEDFAPFHRWLIVEDQWIVDPTAGQFDYPSLIWPVKIQEISASRYKAD